MGRCRSWGRAHGGDRPAVRGGPTERAAADSLSALPGSPGRIPLCEGCLSWWARALGERPAAVASGQVDLDAVGIADLAEAWRRVGILAVDGHSGASGRASTRVTS